MKGLNVYWSKIFEYIIGTSRGSDGLNPPQVQNYPSYTEGTGGWWNRWRHTDSYSHTEPGSSNNYNKPKCEGTGPT